MRDFRIYNKKIIKSITSQLEQMVSGEWDIYNRGDTRCMYSLTNVECR